MRASLPGDRGSHIELLSPSVAVQAAGPQRGPMTAPAHSTAAEATPAMPSTPGSQTPAVAPTHAPVRTAAGIGRRAWEQFADNPLQALFATAIVALLVLNFTITNARIDDTNDRITRLEDRMDARFAALEEDVAEANLKLTALIAALEEDVAEANLKLTALIAALDEDVAEINLKLTALIAALNRTDEVDAALEGRLIDRTPVPDPADVPSR